MNWLCLSQVLTMSSDMTNEAPDLICMEQPCCLEEAPFPQPAWEEAAEFDYTLHHVNCSLGGL